MASTRSHIHAVAQYGQTGDISTQLGVDTRTPGVLTPAPGASIGGSTGWVFTPTPGFPVASVEVYCQNGGVWANSSSTPNADGTFSGSIDTTQCPNGSTSLVAVASWSDEFGVAHSWSAPAVPVTIFNEPPPPQPWVSSGGDRDFSPNGDGQEDTATVYFCESQDATVDVSVTDASGATVRTLESAAHWPAGCYYDYYGDYLNEIVTWDGTDDDGTVVPDGVYTIHVHAVDQYGQTGDTSTQLGVDTRTPGVLSAPSSGASIGGSTGWVFTPTPGFPVASVEVYCQNGGGANSSSTPNADGTFSGSIDTTQCPNGSTSLVAVASWSDEFGVAHSWSAPAVPVTIFNEPPPPQPWVSSGGDRDFSPNGDGQEDTATVYFCESQDADVTVTITNDSGVAVRTVDLGQQTGYDQPTTYCSGDEGYYSEDNQSFTWDGTGDSGSVVPDGVYTVDIHALASDGADRGRDDAVGGGGPDSGDVDDAGVSTSTPNWAVASQVSLRGQRVNIDRVHAIRDDQPRIIFPVPRERLIVFAVGTPHPRSNTPSAGRSRLLPDVNVRTAAPDRS